MSSRSPSHDGGRFSNQKLTPFEHRKSSKMFNAGAGGPPSTVGSVANSPMDVYQNQPVKGSPTNQTKEQTLMNNTMTSDWKSKLSPRARGRIQIALPTDDNTEFNPADEATTVGGDARGIPATENLAVKKEFAQTGNFPARGINFGRLNSGEDKHRKTSYNNGSMN